MNEKNSKTDINHRGKAVLFLCALLLVGCSEDSQTPIPESPTVWIPDVTISGSGSSRVGEMALTSGVGHIVLAGVEWPAMIYETTDWEEYNNLKIFHAIVPAGEELHLLFIYSRGDTISSVWHESYSIHLGQEPATGSVEFAGNYVEQSPTLSSLEHVPTASNLISGISVAGSEISLEEGQGTLLIDAAQYSVFAFGLVDCLDCIDGESNGWLELHSVLQSEQGRLGFGVLYLMADPDSETQLGHVVFLNPLEHGSLSEYQAQWTYESQVSGQVFRRWAWE
jgi:hypothetical protein